MYLARLPADYFQRNQSDGILRVGVRARGITEIFRIQHACCHWPDRLFTEVKPAIVGIPWGERTVLPHR